MCELKSCLVLKGRVFCPAYDSHQQMLEELKIKDDEVNALKTFVRVELTPPDGVRGLDKPLSDWQLKVDQDMRPDWWDEAAYSPMIKEAVEAWRKEHVFASGEHEVMDGQCYALGNATVRVSGSATVRVSGSATVRAYDNATVEASDSATVRVSGSATVEAYDNATVRAYDNATVIWPLLRKIIYPAGWTAETHD